MKTHHFLFSLLFAFLILSCSKNDPASFETKIDLRSSVVPDVIDNWTSGDAYFECSQTNSNCAFAWKVDDSAPNGEYHTDSDQYGNAPTDFNAIIEIYNSDGTSFSWSSTHRVCAVIVKGGQGAHVYNYSDGSCGDTELTAPINPNNGQHFDVSHVTFCFTDAPCDGSNQVCYEDETAWADGDRYTNRGNWAMYVTYDLDLGDDDYPTLTVDLIAGRRHEAGTVTLSSPDGLTVDILIELNDGWIFYYDEGDSEADDNVKVQDYDEAPSGNPAPGLFDWKETADVASSSYTISVPYNSYYGIHVDVAKEVDCED